MQITHVIIVEEDMSDGSLTDRTHLVDHFLVEGCKLLAFLIWLKLAVLL